MTLYFYSHDHAEARASITLMALAKDSRVKPVRSFTADMTYNYSLSGLAEEELVYSMTVSGGLTVRYIGGEDALPVEMFVCSRLGKGECWKSRVIANKRHTAGP